MNMYEDDDRRADGAPAESNDRPTEEEHDPALDLPEIPSAPAAPGDAPLSLPPAAPPASQPRRSGLKTFMAAIALVAIGALVGSATTYSLSGRLSALRTPIGFLPDSPSDKAQKVSDLPFIGSNAVPIVYRKAVPAVVKIEASSGNSFTRGSTATGSGFVVDPRGYILTNHHVISGSNKIKVKFVDGTELTGSVVGSDKFRDLAVVKVDAGGRSMVALPLGDSQGVEIGELAIAIGSPFGNDYTVTAGIVSGLNREIEEEDNPFRIPGAIQTDAAINPGNSGGPLLNANGEVIGINTAIESPLRGSVGIGFAVPINAAKEILPTLIAGKRVEYPWLGVGMYPLSADLADQVGSSVKEGVLIQQVYKGSPADQAGLQGPQFNRRGAPVQADIITAIDGQPMKSPDDLGKLVADKKVGDTLTMTVVRGKETITLQATLTARPDSLDSGD